MILTIMGSIQNMKDVVSCTHHSMLWWKTNIGLIILSHSGKTMAPEYKIDIMVFPSSRLK